MKQKILFLTVLVCLTLTVNAQNAEQARKILDKTASLLNRKGGASANFIFNNGTKESFHGTIAIKGKKFYAKTQQASTWFNGKTQWTYMVKSEEVNVSNPNEAQQARMNPYKFITLYKKGYTLGMTDTTNDYKIHLIAQSKQSSIPEMYITINKKTNLPTQVKMLQKEKWSTITISNFKAKNLSDSMFSFNLKDFPNAEIIDLR